VLPSLLRDTTTKYQRELDTLFGADFDKHFASRKKEKKKIVVTKKASPNSQGGGEANDPPDPNDSDSDDSVSKSSYHTSKADRTLTEQDSGALAKAMIDGATDEDTGYSRLSHPESYGKGNATNTRLLKRSAFDTKTKWSGDYTSCDTFEQIYKAHLIQNQMGYLISSTLSSWSYTILMDLTYYSITRKLKLVLIWILPRIN
jgi:hypothetical protein